MASGNDHWNTPRELFEPALRLCGSAFDCDPFNNEHSIVPAAVRFDGSKSRDGFTRGWDGRAWVNGPWSQQKSVVEKCVREAIEGAEIFLVQPSSINASYWPHIMRAPARCYPTRRVSFMRDGKSVKGNRTDIVLVYWGLRPWAFREVYRALGEVDR